MLKQDENDFVLLNKAKDLYVYTSEAVGNDKVIPKHRRYTVGQRLETLAIDFCGFHVYLTRTGKVIRKLRQFTGMSIFHSTFETT